MIVLYLAFTLRAPWCNSLKDKRSVVRRLMSRLRAAMDVSVREAGAQAHHRLIVLASCALVFDSTQADAITQRLTHMVETATDAELIRVEKAYR